MLTSTTTFFLTILISYLSAKQRVSKCLCNKKIDIKQILSRLFGHMDNHASDGYIFDRQTFPFFY